MIIKLQFRLEQHFSNYRIVAPSSGMQKYNKYIKIYGNLSTIAIALLYN